MSLNRIILIIVDIFLSSVFPCYTAFATSFRMLIGNLLEKSHNPVKKKRS